MDRRSFLKAGAGTGLLGGAVLGSDIREASADCIEELPLGPSPFLELDLVDELYADLDQLLTVYEEAGNDAEHETVTAHLDSIEAVLVTEDTVAAFPIWEDFLEAHAEKRYFFFLAGDYRSWRSRPSGESDDVPRIHGVSGESVSRRKVLACFSWDESYKYQPVHRPLANEKALVPDLRFSSVRGGPDPFLFASNWLITGLTTEGKTGADRSPGWFMKVACHVTVDNCLIDCKRAGIDVFPAPAGVLTMA